MNGEIYQSVPEKVLAVMDGVQYKTRRTHIAIPDDADAALARIAAIDQQNRW